MLLRLSESKTPNPSSIAKKFGLGNDVVLINDVRIANDATNFSMPDVNSNGQ